MLRRLLIIASLLLTGPAFALVGLLQFGHAPTGVTTWTPLAIGGGGFVTGIDVKSGAMVNRTDTYGGYRWNGSQWVQLVTIQSMPAAQVGLEKDVGVNEVRIAPSNTARFYMNYNGQMFRSDNSGATWTLLSNYATVTWSANDNNIKTMGPFIAIDPVNADVVLASTPGSGLRISSDAGATWSTVPTVANASTSRGNLVAFDPASTVVGGKTQGIFATSYGTGVYHSTDGGASWTLLNTANMPTTHCHLIIDQNGVLWMSDASGNASVPCYGSLKKWTASTWTAITAGSQSTRVHGIVVDPANANNIWLGMDSGDLITSTNGGGAWTDPNFNNTRAATDIPWLAFANESYMTAGDIAYNSVTGRLMFPMGIGVFYTTSPGPTVTWTSQTIGIENLVANMALSPTGGGKPVVSSWDRPTFYVNNPLTYPSTHGAANPQANAIVSGWSIDYASTSPTTFVCICTWPSTTATAGYSTDGGQTWTAFPTVPTNVPDTFFNGSIAASTASNFVWVPYINAPRIYFTNNTGTTWTASTVTGVATSGETGWSNTFNNFLDRQIVCADRVTSGTFYVYNIGVNGDATFAGVYKSTDGGATFARVKVGLIGSYAIDSFNATMSCVPGNAGHLFFTGGQVGGSTTGSFYRSTDGGVNWTALSGVTEVYAFGFGKAVASGYPALYIAGFVGGTAASDWGIWRSDDADQATPTWTRISDGYPSGNFSQIKTVSGDMNTYGTVYVGTIGASWLYGKLN